MNSLEKTVTVELTRAELWAIIAAMHFTSSRSNVWLPLDKNLLTKLKEIDKNR